MNQGLAIALFAAGAALGALARGFVLQALNSTRFPTGTLTVNLGGSLLAAVAVSRVPEAWSTITAVAALGSFTTFSTFAVEVADMWEGRRVAASVYGVSTVAGAVALAFIGLGL
ncbi:MAG: CrcB family protein [Microthrixaceae bacterium]